MSRRRKLSRTPSRSGPTRGNRKCPDAERMCDVRGLGREDLLVYIRQGEEGSRALPEKFPPLATPAHAQSLRDAKRWLSSRKRRRWRIARPWTGREKTSFIQTGKEP